MNEQDAEFIIGMIENHWRRRIDEARPLWLDFLGGQDAERATTAVAKLAATDAEFPKISVLKEMIGTVPGSAPEIEPGLCQTCFGDMMVLVQTRPPVQSTWMAERGIDPAADSEYDECVPCPTCNADADTSYFVIGKPYRPLDPATVRERMRPLRVDPSSPRSPEVPASVREWLKSGPRSV